MIRSLFLSLAFASLASAHICMWSPRQRGAIALDSPGDPSCSHKGPSPCGGVASSGAVTKYTAGQAVTVEFQQSLNHFYGSARASACLHARATGGFGLRDDAMIVLQGDSSDARPFAHSLTLALCVVFVYAVLLLVSLVVSPNPGYLSVQIAKGSDPLEPDFSYQFGSVVPDWNAMDEVAFANISVSGVMPAFECEACVLRLTYASNNPGENDTSTLFFQCADIVIGGAEETTTNLWPELPSGPAASASASAPAAHAHKRSAAASDDSGCCTVPQWESLYYTAGGVPFSGAGSIHYDATNRLIMSVTQIGTSTSQDWEAHYSNFSSGIEWRYRSVGGVESCSAYGLDEWNAWCYGAGQNEAWTDSILIGGQWVSVYANELADWSWGVAQGSQQGDECTPVFRQHGPSAILQEYFNLTTGIAQPAVFVAPAACHMHAKDTQLRQAWEMQQGSDLEAVREFSKRLPRAPAAAGAAAGTAGTKAHLSPSVAAASKPTHKKHGGHKKHSSSHARGAMKLPHEHAKPIAHPQPKKKGQ